ncbi:MAG: signal recognition particle-docking protein FtsY [Cellulosilyticum sp.]|nr:signal recognition particle-docking protein FtsY [Cellulosilyticum sp.]
MSLFKRLFGKKKVEEVETVSPEIETIEIPEEEEVNSKEEIQIDGEEEEMDILVECPVEESMSSKEKDLAPVQNVLEENNEIQEEALNQAEESFEQETRDANEETSIVSEIEIKDQEITEKKDTQSVKDTEEINVVEADEVESDKEQTEETHVIEEVPKKQGLIKRLFSGLSKTRDQILKGVDDVLSNFKHIDEDLYEELEEALIMADFGVDTTLHIMEKLKAKVKEEKIADPVELKPALQSIITKFLTEQPTEDILNTDGPTVVLVIGVNGAGKTTSIGKMSHLFKSQGKRVLVAAADTFRAAAIEQLNVWTERAGVEIIKHSEGSDAAAVVFDAVAAAKSRKADVLICDTAGRLQNKTNLMKELEKISRIIAREYPEAKKEILIVIDATTGQNALQQVKLFKEVADISGIILTKLDGTAKGGAIVGIYESLKVPVKYIGVGEKIDDLQPFDAEAFAKALFETEV